jgi:SAM-dependent methyltransferase
LFDVRYGVHTDRWVDLNDLDVIGANRDQAKNYQPVKSDLFRSAIASFRIPLDGVFVDYGSGKGRVLMLAILYGFHRVVGVEFAQALCIEAEQNLQKFRRRTNKQFDANVQNVDASDYAVGDQDCVFFFYNPFGSDVLSQVLNNIRQSLQSKPRLVHVVYANPDHREVIDGDPFWRQIAETTSGGFEPVVYYQPR